MRVWFSSVRTLRRSQHGVGRGAYPPAAEGGAAFVLTPECTNLLPLVPIAAHPSAGCCAGKRMTLTLAELRAEAASRGIWLLDRLAWPLDR